MLYSDLFQGQFSYADTLKKITEYIKLTSEEIEKKNEEKIISVSHSILRRKSYALNGGYDYEGSVIIITEKK